MVELFVLNADTTEAPLPVIEPGATLVARFENDPGGYCPCNAMWRLPGIPRGDIVVVAAGGGGGGGEDTDDPAEEDVFVLVNCCAGLEALDGGCVVYTGCTSCEAPCWA